MDATITDIAEYKGLQNIVLLIIGRLGILTNINMRDRKLMPCLCPCCLDAITRQKIDWTVKEVINRGLIDIAIWPDYGDRANGYRELTAKFYKLDDTGEAETILASTDFDFIMQQYLIKKARTFRHFE